LMDGRDGGRFKRMVFETGDLEMMVQILLHGLAVDGVEVTSAGAGSGLTNGYFQINSLVLSTFSVNPASISNLLSRRLAALPPDPEGLNITS